jgi:hypothetical protein
MSLWYVAHLNTYLDLGSYLQDTKIRFNYKLNLSSAIGNFSKSQHLASYVSHHNAMVYDMELPRKALLCTSLCLQIGKVRCSNGRHDQIIATEDGGGGSGLPQLWRRQ